MSTRRERGAGPSPRDPSLGRTWGPTARSIGGGGAGWVLLFLGAAAVFVGAAAVRRLNFDEALALRSGYLEVAGVPADPPFAMPLTVGLGLLARAVADPGTVFLIARLVVSLGVVATLLLATWRAAGEIAVASLAGVLTIAQAAFFVHGLEFRYDAAILVGTVLALPALTRAGHRDFVVLGAVTGWLAAHGVKGLFFAAVVGGLAAARARRSVGAARRIAAGAAAVVSVWGAVAALTGTAGSAVRAYRFFFALGTGAVARVGVWAALGPTFRRDGAWWIVAAVAVVATIVGIWRNGPASAGNDPDLWALVLAAATLGFVALHPIPWPYMLALPAPFLAFLVARRAFELRPGVVRAAVVAGVGGVIAVQSLVGPGLAPVVAASFASGRGGEVATLRLLQRVMTPRDRIVDPSGLAYFIPPCTAQWYVDSLLQGEVQRGQWMAAMNGLDPGSCPLALVTYRLNMLPARAKERVAREYVEVSGAAAIARGDPRLDDRNLWPKLAKGPIDSFW